ncbi:MAG: glycosyl hydrolase family 16 [Lacinutrix sp.]|uniref:glycosyl hydrolase family 16 n=1 Tax=Lacinutrix sp. TaxID=1937692 RepID=UPI00309E3642
MKTRKNIYPKIFLCIGLIFITAISCERELSDEAEFATFSTTGEIFTDNFQGGLDYFPFGGSFAEAFSVDFNEKYLGSASMRFDIPQFGVSYGGATFPSLAPRDLSQYDALTFWAKASQGADINEIGFGINGETNNKFQVTMQNLPLTTVWTKYVIAIPDASKLNQEKGMFWYAEGAENSFDEGGYTFWIDELRFEKLETIAQPRPAIFNGQDVVQTAFIGSPITVTGLTQTFNLANGQNQTVSAAPSYFTFTSSDTDIAIVNELGLVSIIGIGTAEITAVLGGVAAEGTLTVNSVGDFQFAPTPTLDPSTVLSVFSDTYTNVPVDYYNGFWTPGSTTGSADFAINGDNILSYTNFNYVGTAMSSPTLDASSMTHFHLNMYVPDNVPSDFDFLISIEDWGANQIDNGGDDTRQQIFVDVSQVQPDTWITVDVPLTLTNKNNIGLIIYENINGSSLSNFYIDNVYFHQ